MEIRTHHDWLKEHAIAVIMVMIFGIMVGVAFQYPKDARLFPLIVGTIGLILSLGVLSQSVSLHLSERSAVEPPAPDASSTQEPHAMRVRSYIALSAAPAYGILLWLAGFYISSGAALIVLPYGLGYRKLGRLLLLMVVSVVLMRIMFTYVMGIQMPPGLLGQWFLETFIYED